MPSPDAAGLEPVVGDVTDPESLSAARAGVDTLFLLTPPSADEAAVKRGVVDAACRAGVRRLVLLSGAGASSVSGISQARQHAAAEAHVKGSGHDWTILQPTFFMQNFFGHAGTIRGNFGGAIRAHGAIYGNTGTGRIAMVDARDVALWPPCVAWSLATGATPMSSPARR